MSKANKKIKVQFVLPSLRAGGAERVMSFVAQNLDKTKFDASLLIVGFEKDKAFELDNVKITFLNTSKVSRATFKIISHLKQEKPDLVISAIGHVNIVMAFISIFFPKIKFIGRETNVKSVRKEHNKKKKFRIKLNLHKLSLKFLDAIICQSNDMLNDLKMNDNIDESKFVVINNPITDKFQPHKKSKQSGVIKYITVGSLHPRKGHDRILKALAKVNHDFSYKIIGKGNFHSIDRLISKLNIEQEITNIEYTDKVELELAQSDIFLNGSYVEGFSNSMLESCAVGTPVIAFNAPGGINEIIIDGQNGYISNSEEEFVTYLNEVNERNPFKESSVSESVTSRFRKEIILSKYETLFENLAFNRSIK